MIKPIKLFVCCLFIGSLGTDCLCQSNRNIFTIRFQAGSTKFSYTNYQQLDSAAKEILSTPYMPYTIVGCSTNENGGNISLQREYNIYGQLIKKFEIPKSQLYLFYDSANCDKNAVIIRPSTRDESSGTNCGVPLFPDLKRK